MRTYIDDPHPLNYTYIGTDKQNLQTEGINMQVCMYVCMYLCMYVLKYVYMYV